jgi:hypothetical protein
VGSPGKGRFNPHGEQPEPVPIQPKSPVKKLSPTKKKVVAVEDEDFSKFEIE